MQINKDLVISGTNMTLGDTAYKDIYSTTETKTNKVWIDGKPIYRKVVEFGGFPNNGSKDVATGIENISRITQFEYSWYDSADKNYLSGNRIDSSGVMCKVMFNFSKKCLHLEGLGTNWSGRTSQGIAIIHYTKITD